MRRLWFGLRLMLAAAPAVHAQYPAPAYYPPVPRAYPYQPYDIRERQVTSEAQAINAAQTARGSQMNQILAEMSPYR